MSRVFITSDLHFSHKNLCENIRKTSPENNDELIINNWNKVISKKDIVYVLGDLTMDNPLKIKEIIPKLKGNIRIIGGNHDTLRCMKVLKSFDIPVLGCLQYRGFILTHIPIHPDELYRFRANIHGDYHKSDLPYLGHKYYNVNCELHNYTPILFEDIEKCYKVLY